MPALLHSAIENVVRNAMFYSGQEGKIEVRLDKSGDSAVVTVRDNGPGVPENALPLLFKPFYRVDDSRGTTTGGMGLGLAIVRNAVAVHGGTVSAKNVVPHGLEVELRLPLVAHARSQAHIGNTPGEGVSGRGSFLGFAPGSPSALCPRFAIGSVPQVRHRLCAQVRPSFGLTWAWANLGRRPYAVIPG